MNDKSPCISSFISILILGFGLLFTMLALPSCNKTFDESDSKILARIANKHCPDPRVCIWNISINPQGRAIKISGETDLPVALEELKDSLKNDGFIVKDSDVKLYPDTSLGTFRYALSKPTVLNIRSAPSFSSELATQALMGWPLTLKYREGDWFRVQTTDGYLGWANIAALQLLTETDFQDYLNQDHAIYLGPETSVLTSRHGKALQDLTSGALLTIKSKHEISGYNIMLTNGLSGYVESDYLVDLNRFREASGYMTEEMLDIARSWIGRPYLWGGTSPRAMDCSGYTKMIFQQLGFDLPRDASQQVHLGDTVTTDADLPGVVPGDFLYFGKKSEEGEKDKVTHVAIYMGNGRIIHSTGQVQIQSLRPDDPDFAEDRYKTFLVAKRMDTEKLERLSLN